MIRTLTLREHASQLLFYLLQSESSLLVEAMEREYMGYEDAMNRTPLGHMLCIAHQLDLVEGAPDEEILEILERSDSDYRPFCEAGE